MRILLLRLQAPLMSFGGTTVDNRGVTLPFPGRAMLTGLLANALGWTHGDFERLGALQGRLRIASRCDKPGRPLRDYHTVDLGQDFMREGWTTWGKPEGRKGGSGDSTHIRLRDYWADRIQVVALALAPEDEAPTLDALHDALQRPARPLFIGRKTCLPSAPIALGLIDADSPEDALQRTPRLSPGEDALMMWSEALTTAPMAAHDLRDWRNQTHMGEAWIGQTLITTPDEEAPHHG